MPEWAATRTVRMEGVEEALVGRLIGRNRGSVREHVEVDTERRGERGEDIVHQS